MESVIYPPQDMQEPCYFTSVKLHPGVCFRNPSPSMIILTFVTPSQLPTTWYAFESSTQYPILAGSKSKGSWARQSPSSMFKFKWISQVPTKAHQTLAPSSNLSNETFCLVQIGRRDKIINYALSCSLYSLPNHCFCVLQLLQLRSRNANICMKVSNTYTQGVNPGN